MRKRGAKIKNRVALIPLRIKCNKYEIDARAALLALENGCAAQEHLVSLYTLADLAERMSCDYHILQHAQSIKRLCQMIYDSNYHCSGMAYRSMMVSADLLLVWMLQQKNALIDHHARAAVREIDRMSA